MKSQYKLHLGDTKKIISSMIEDGKKVDMIFTSPPYFSMRKNYSGNDDATLLHQNDRIKSSSLSKIIKFFTKKSYLIIY